MITEQEVLSLGFEPGTEMPSGYKEFYLQIPRYDTDLYIWCDDKGVFETHIDADYGQP